MGDIGQEPLQNQLTEHSLAPTETEEVTVLVTGFGWNLNQPFKTFLANASHIIASSLPSSLELPSKGSASGSRRISIHVHPAPIPVSYSTIRNTVPEIVDGYAKDHGGRRPDIVVHIGIAVARGYYSVETLAHRDSYRLPDINGKSGFQDGELYWRKLNLPAILKAGRAIDSEITTTRTPSSSPPSAAKPYANSSPPDEHFLGVWKAFGPPKADLRISSDAGRYACEFILYTSLAHAFLSGQDRNVAFLHVPGSCNEEDIEHGRNITIAFLKALVTCWFDKAGTEQ